MSTNHFHDRQKDISSAVQQGGYRPTDPEAAYDDKD